MMPFVPLFNCGNYMTKRDAFFTLLSFSLERYVDRETSACYFDSEGFRDLVGFMQSLPDKVDAGRAQEAEEEIRRRIENGTQMLEGMVISWPSSICYTDGLWLEHAAFPGYPTVDGSSGSFFYLTGTILGMSSTGRNKDAAWEYIRTLITPRLSGGNVRFEGIPVNQHDYEAICRYELKVMKEAASWLPDPKAALKLFVMDKHFQYGYKIPMLDFLTEAELQRHRNLIDHTTQLYWPEDELSNIVWETLGSYFAGDRTLDDMIGLLQNRVGLYLNEQK